MTGYSPKLPLSYDSIDGPYALNKDLRDVVKQNLKMLLLTNPGERIMNTDYGVGVKRLLFENRTSAEIDRIQTVIIDQISKYMSYLGIKSINIETVDTTPGMDENSAYIFIEYIIPSIKAEDTITLILSAN